MLSPDIIKILLEISVAIVTIIFTLPFLAPYQVFMAPFIWLASKSLSLVEDEPEPKKEFNSFFKSTVKPPKKDWAESCILGQGGLSSPHPESHI